jgi:Domain of Unknown Function (DUF1259)
MMPDRRLMMRLSRAGFLLAICALAPAAAVGQDMPPAYRAVLDTLGRTGDYADGVLKVSVPRGDLHVTIDGTAVPTALGFGGWLAMTHGDKGADALMGDLVLTESEVNPVMSALLDHGLEVTALHNHFFYESPRIFYMHVHGHGTPAELAARVKPALGLIPAPPSSTGPTPASQLDGEALSKALGAPGQMAGPVFKITVGRPDLTVRDEATLARVTTRMGLNTWAAFAGTMDAAIVAGDVAMLAPEVTPVLKALRGRGIEVVAIHQHMTATAPMVFFLHYLGRGAALELAAGVRAALDQLGPAAGGHDPSR